MQRDEVARPDTPLNEDAREPVGCSFELRVRRAAIACDDRQCRRRQGRLRAEYFVKRRLDVLQRQLLCLVESLHHRRDLGSAHQRKRSKRPTR